LLPLLGYFCLGQHNFCFRAPIEIKIIYPKS
jgi:hypothetical protein